MEQTNMTNDIDQPVENSSVNQMISKSDNIFKYVFPIFIIIFFIFTIYSLYSINIKLNKLSQTKPDDNNIQTESVINNTKENPTPINNSVTDIKEVSVTKKNDLIPQKNTIYFGTYQGKETLFTLLPPQFNEKDPYLGNLIVSGGVGSRLDYRKIENPKIIFSSLNKTIDSINNFIFNDSKDFIYISLNFDGEGQDPNNIINTIFQVNIKNLSYKELWSNKVGSNKYPDAKGGIYLDKVYSDKYLTFNINNCHFCSAQAVGGVVLNINTKNEKYFQMGGDIEVNIINNKVTYKKLVPIKETQLWGPDEEIEVTILKPTGQILTESLP